MKKDETVKILKSIYNLSLVNRVYSAACTCPIPLYTPQKVFAPLTLYSLYLKLSESVILQKVNNNVWNNTITLYGYVET